MTFPGPPVPAAVFAPKTAAARARALVLAPVLPQWDEGAFFAPVVRALTGAGVHVTVVDTLAAWDEDITSLAALTDRWRTLLPRFGPFDLLCGNALGGALAQALLPSVAPATGVLLVSAPTVADAVLEQRLTEIADAARAGDLAGSLALLDHYVSPGRPGEDVRPEGAGGSVRPGRPGATQPGRTDGAVRSEAGDAADLAAAGSSARAGAPGTAAPGTAPRGSAAAAAAARLAGGLPLLHGIDNTEAVRRHPGPLLSIVGGASRLVARRHVAVAAAPHHCVQVVSGSGMRPHTENTAEVSAAVTAFVETFLQQKEA